MADIRINSLSTTASSTASDDFIAVDGTTNGTRKLNAYSPTFGGNLTVNGTGSINGGSGAAAFAIKETASAATALSLANRNSTQTWGIAVDAAAIDDKLLAFISGGTVALSLNATNWNATLAGNLTVSGTGTSSFAGRLFGINTTSPDDFGAAYSTLQINAVSAGGGAYSVYKNVADSINFRVGADGQGVINVVSNHPLLLNTNNTERLRVTASGNLLIGTTTDSANGKLQLTSHTTSAGGIGFGTDWGIYRKSQYTLGLNVASGAKPLFFYTDVTNVGLFDQADVNTTTGWSGYYITPGDKALKLATNSTTALTLDSSQNATFAGRIKSSDQTTVSLTASTAYNLIATSDVLTVNTLANSIVMLTVTGSDGVDGGFCGYYLLNLNVAFGTYTVTTIASGLPQNAGSAYTFTFTLDANYLKVTCGKNTGFRYNYSVLEGPNLS